MSDSLVLGVDPGLGTTGWGVVKAEPRRFVYVDSGFIRTNASMPEGERLTEIYNQLQTVAQKFNVEACAVESGFVGRGPQAALKLGQARAAAVLAAESLNIPVTVLAPREVKMAITGRGGASKGQVAYLVGKMLSLVFDEGEEDVSDALAVAISSVMRQRVQERKAALR
jgi:crossover junction endodeoxyribonuclease RuvC